MWKTLKLDEIVNLSIGKTPSRSNIKFWDKEKISKNIWLSIADLSALGGLYIEDSKEYVSDEGAKLFKTVPSETLVMSFKLSIGKLAITKCELRTNEAIAAMPIKDEKLITKEYLYYFLSSINWDALSGSDEKVKGKTLNKAKLKEIPISFPPLAEQQRIVAKLDAAFVDIDEATELLQSKSAEVKKLKAAILDKNLNEILVQKPKVKLSAACERVSVGHVGTTSKYYCDDGVPFIRTQNVSKNGFDDSELKFITQEFHQSLKKSQLKAGDVLLSRVVIDEMRTAIVPSDYGEANCANVILIRPTQKLSSQFLSLLIQSRESQKYFMGVKKGAAQQVVNTGILKEWTIPLPTIEEQNTFEQIIKESFNIIENLNGDTHKKIEELTKLKSAILAQELQSEAA